MALGGSISGQENDMWLFRYQNLTGIGGVNFSERIHAEEYATSSWAMPRITTYPVQHLGSLFRNVCPSATIDMTVRPGSTCERG